MKKMVWLPALCLAFQLFAQEAEELRFRTLDAERISSFEQKIAREIYINWYARIGFLSTIATLGGMSIYKLFFAHQGPYIPSSTFKPNPQDAIQFTQAHSDVIFKTAAATGALNSPTLFSRLKGWGAYFRDQTITLSMSTFITASLYPITKYLKILDTKMDALVGTVFHPDDLLWFLTTHTNVFALLDELEAQVEALAEYKGAPAFKYSPSQVIMTWNVLISQLESVCGYMHYKQAKLGEKIPDNAQRAMVVITDLITQVNEMSAYFAQHLTPESLTPDIKLKIHTEIVSFRQKVQHHCDTFSAIELIQMY